MTQIKKIARLETGVKILEKVRVDRRRVELSRGIPSGKSIQERA